MAASASKKVTKIVEFESHCVTCLALGQRNVLATGGADGLVSLYVVGQTQPLKSLAGLPSAATCVKFDPSEQAVIAGSASGSLKIWDLEADKIKQSLTGHKSDVTAVDFLSLDPNFIVSGSTDRHVKIWDLRRKGHIISLKQHQDTVKEVLFSPHAKWITSAGIDGTVQIYHWQAGKLLKELVHAKNTTVYSLAFHPNDLLLASSGHDGVVKFWDLETFELISATEKDASPIRCIRFQKDGSSLLAGCDDILRSFGWEPNVCYDVIPVGWGRVGDMAVSGASNQLIAASVGKSTVAAYLVDLTKVRGKNSPAVEEKPIVADAAGPIYKTLPRKLKDPHKRVSQIFPKVPVRSHSKEPVSRGNYNVKAKEVVNNADEVFAPSHQLNRSPEREFSPEASPSSESSSSPSRARRRSISPSVRKTVKTVFHSRNRKLPSDSNIQVIKPMPKESRNEDASRPPLPKSHSDTFHQPKNPVKINMPYRKPQFLPNSPAHNDSPSPDSRDFVPTRYRAPVMPVYPVTKSRFSPHESDDYVLGNNDDLVSSYDAGHRNGAALTRIKVSHGPVLTLLTNRLDNLRSIQHVWGQDVKGIVDAVVRFDDPSTLVDILNILCGKPSLWNLDCCCLILPHLHKLMSHRVEGYVLVAASALKLILKNFAGVIKNNLNAIPNLGVNISQEERMQKSRACHTHFSLLRDFIEKDNRILSPNLRKECRQLKLLMQGLE